MDDRGLDRDGTIAREGALERVPAAFVPVVEAARAHIKATFGHAGLHSAYLYGSIRGVARKLVRTGFTLVMPRWGGWTSDLGSSAEIFGRYYPERLGQMRVSATTARVPSADPAVLAVLINDLGPWLAAEYTAVHGEKAPRP